MSQRDYSTHFIEIVEPDNSNRSLTSLPPENSVKMLNFKHLNNIYTIDMDSPCKNTQVQKFDLSSTLSPPRSKILELLRPEDPGRDALEAIVRPNPRRGLARPLDEDTQRFLHRALQSTAPYTVSTDTKPEQRKKRDSLDSVAEISSSPKCKNSSGEVSLADELMEAEEEAKCGASPRRDLIDEFTKRRDGIREEVERERLAKLALAVEDDEGEEDDGLSAAARRLDALLAESRNLHEELAEIQEDLQVLVRRVARGSPQPMTRWYRCW